MFFSFSWLITIDMKYVTRALIHPTPPPSLSLLQGNDIFHYPSEEEEEEEEAEEEEEEEEEEERERERDA